MEIVSLPIDIDKKTIGSRFRLVIIAAQRARQLMEGDRPTLQEIQYVKETSTAVEEVVSGGLEILYGEEAQEAQREANRLREEKRARAILDEREEALSGELRKNLNIQLAEAPPTAS
ncbi:MAG: DNA-directed RNA polymerase subunit omega [Nitrospira sp.]|nr:DNA-directed RNA polymerase subunit omega [Candidatus Manganitrophaceae bacterium]HIL35812.1 DNA-directed RNA polymerase subunit omega [Candidatus Manganitrophaceae bacterium]